jgi:hypothetical protein
MTDYNPLTGTGSVFKKETITIPEREVPTTLRRVETGIAGATRLAPYAVPVFGEGLLVSETAKAGETLLDKEATEEERNRALIEGGVATTFLVGGGVIKGIRTVKKARTAKELKALDKAETRFLSLIDDEGKNMGTISEIKVGKDKYYSFAESSLDDTVSATSGKLLKIEKRGGKLLDYEALGFSKEVPIKKVQIPKKTSGNLNIVEVDLAGKGSVSQSLVKFTKGEKGKEMLLFSDIKTKPIKLKDLPKAKRSELGARFITRDDLIFVEAGKPRAVLTKKGIVYRTDVRTKGIIQKLRKQPKNPLVLEQSEKEILRLIKEPKAKKLLKEAKPFLREGRLEPIKVPKLKERDIFVEKPTDLNLLKLQRAERQRALYRTSPGRTFDTGARKELEFIDRKILEKAKQESLKKVSAQQSAFRALETQRINRGLQRTEKALDLLKKGRTPSIMTSFGLSSLSNVKEAKDSFQGALSAESFVLGQKTASLTDLEQSTNPLFDASKDVTNIQDVLNGQTQIEIIAGKTKKETIITEPKPEPPTPEPTIPTTTKPIIKPKRKKAKLVSGQGYDAYVKRFSTDKNKMIWQKLNPKPLTRKSALGEGAETSDKDISARFKIKKAKVEYEKKKVKGVLKKTKKKKKILDTGSTYYDDNIEKFREYKIRKGKKLKTTGTYIEKAKFRLDTPTEKQQIQRASSSPMIFAPGEVQNRQSTRIIPRTKRSIPLVNFTSITTKTRSTTKAEPFSKCWKLYEQSFGYI